MGIRQFYVNATEQYDTLRYTKAGWAAQKHLIYLYMQRGNKARKSSSSLVT